MGWKILYNSVLLESEMIITGDPPDSNPNVPAGYKSTNVVDCNRNTCWKILDDYGGAAVAFRFQPSVFYRINAIGIAHLNGKAAHVDRVQLRSSPNGSSWTTLAYWDNLYLGLFNLSEVPDYVDLIMGLSTSRTLNAYNQIVVYFYDAPNGIIAGDLLIGEIMVGTAVDVGDPDGPLATDLILPAAMNALEAGGLSAVARGNRYEYIPAEFSGLNAAGYQALRDIVHAQRGAVKPMLIHTHRHTGALDYRTIGDATIVFAEDASWIAGAYFCQFNDTQFRATDVHNSIVYDVSFPLRRSMRSDEV